MPGSESLIDDAMTFTRELRDNNTRDWFRAQKERYETRLKAPALALLEVMRPALKDLTGHDATPKLFRPQRDVRFSKDKTPYKAHLHMLWRLDAGGRQDPALFFGIDPEGASVGIGVLEFGKDVLADWRKMLDLDGPRFAAAIEGAQAQGWRLWEPELKRVPSPFGQDHPQADLLRQKRIVLTRGLPGDGPLIPRLTSAYEQTLPLLGVLDSVL